MALFVLVVLVTGLLVATDLIRKGKQKRIRQAYDFHPEKTQASAEFATGDQLKKAGYFESNGIRVGLSPDGKRVLRYGKAGHLALISAARMGKAFTVLVASILSLPRRYSLICIDPKAELCAITGHYRRRFGNVYVLNPFGILREHLAGLTQARFNPMSILDPSSSSFHATCDKLAEAICPDDIGGSDRHWIMSARLLISGVIATLARYGSPIDRNLPAMRDVITGAKGRSVFDFCRRCMTRPDPFIRQKLARFAAEGAEDSKELNAVVSTADTCTGFLGNEAIAESLKGSDFTFHDLKRQRGTTVFVCLPLNKLDVCSAYFRLIMAALLSDLLEEGLKGKGVPVLCIVDEMAQIGPLKALTDAWGMAAGAAGLQIWAVYQDVSQLMNQFGKGWQTIIQNCGVTLWFGARDQATREAVSKLAGVTEVPVRNRSVSVDHRTGEPHISDSMSSAVRPVVHPHEVGALASDEMLMFCEGVPGVVKAKRRPYLAEFRGKYRPNPYFGKPSWRERLFR
jgi:type IV secretion system protein VirD4